MESEHLATNEEVVGSSPSVFTNFIFRGRLIGRTAGSEPVNTGSNPFPEANYFPGRSTGGYMGLFWKQVFAGSNPAARTNIFRPVKLKSV